MSTIGRNVKRIRLNKGMTKEELSKKAGYKGVSMITAIEDGTKEPSFEKKLDIAKALGVSIKDLLGKKDNLTEKEKLVLSGLSAYLEDMPEEDIELGVHIFKLVYIGYLHKAGLMELKKVQDTKSYNYHKEKYPPKDIAKYFKEPVFPKEENKRDKIDKYFYIEKRGKRAEDNPARNSAQIFLKDNKNVLGYEVVVKGVSKARGAFDKEPNVEIEVLTEIFSHDIFSDVETIYVYTKNSYIEQGINKWLPGWERNDWKKADGKEVKHLEFWKLVSEVKKQYKVIAVGEENERG